MEGADGSSSSSDPVQSIQGTVMRMFTKDGANAVKYENGNEGGNRLTWYTGDDLLVDGIRYLDVLHYTLGGKDYGYFVKKGSSGSVNYAPVEIIDGVEKINYSVNYQDVSGATYIGGGSEWEAF